MWEFTKQGLVKRSHKVAFWEMFLLLYFYRKINSIRVAALMYFSSPSLKHNEDILLFHYRLTLLKELYGINVLY